MEKLTNTDKPNQTVQKALRNKNTEHKQPETNKTRNAMKKKQKGVKSNRH